MGALIDGELLKPLSDFGIELLNKIEKASGWILSEQTAQKEGYKKIIDEISKREDINPFERAIIISNFNKIKKEYKNKAYIVDKTIGLLENGKNIENIDNDWILNFFELCKNVSNEDMQYVWSKALANECDGKRHHSIKLLRLLTDINKTEIDTIFKVLDGCNYGMKMFDSIGILSLGKEYLDFINVKYEDIIELEDLGIIKREVISIEDNLEFETDKKIVRYMRRQERKGRLRLKLMANYYRFTNIGMEMLELIDMTEHYSEDKYFKNLEKALENEYVMEIEIKNNNNCVD